MQVSERMNLKTALFAENNGLALYQQLIHESQTMLKADGKIYFEIGFQTRRGPPKNY